MRLTSCALPHPAAGRGGADFTETGLKSPRGKAADTQRSRSPAIASGLIGLVLLAASAWLLRELSSSVVGFVVGVLLAVWGLGAFGLGLALLLGLVRRAD
jgi:hypothetical protein